MKKVLVIYTSVGLGHKIIAENIAQALREREGLKEGVEVEMLDVIKFYGGALQNEFQEFYLWMLNRAPGLWRFFYTNKIFNALTLPLRIPVASLRAKKLEGYLASSKPDLILTTETIPTAIVSYLKLKKRFAGKIVTTFSDYHFQPYWVYPRVDRWLAIIPEHIDDILNCGYGYKREQIVLTSMPIDEAFYREHDRSEVLKKYNLPVDKPIVAIMGGSRGWGIGAKETAALLALPENPAVIFFTGTSEELYRQLSPLTAQHPRLRLFRWMHNSAIAEIFSVSRVLVTKAGGLTLAGAIAAHLPSVLINPLHIGEELNEEYLLKHGVGFRAKDIAVLTREVSRLLHDQEHYEKVREKMRNLATPGAAAKAARAIVDIL